MRLESYVFGVTQLRLVSFDAKEIPQRHPDLDKVCMSIHCIFINREAPSSVDVRRTWCNARVGRLAHGSASRVRRDESEIF